MFLVVIITFTSLMMLACCHFLYGPACELKKGTIMGAYLPSYGADHPDVRALQERYRKRIRFALVSSLVLHIPVFPLCFWYLSIMMLYYFFWCVWLFFWYMHSFTVTFREFWELKKEHHWFSEASLEYVEPVKKWSEKAKGKPLSRKWFLPSFLLCLAPLTFGAIGMNPFSREGFPLLFFLSLGLNIVFFLLYVPLVSKFQATVSQIPEYQRLFTALVRKHWSRCLPLCAFTQSLTFLLMEIYLILERPFSLYFWTFFLSLEALTFLIFLLGNRKVQKEKEDLLREFPEPYLADEDQYWLKGYYDNPDDKRILVENRTCSTNLSFNMGHPVGKILNCGIWTFVAALLIWVFAMLLEFDFHPFTMTVSKDLVSIDAPKYGLEFSLDEVDDIRLLDQLPEESFYKNNGAATEQYMLGKFRSKTIGQCRFYYYKGYSPVLRIDLPEFTVFFNSKDPDETEALYLQVLSSCRKKAGISSALS